MYVVNIRKAIGSMDMIHEGCFRRFQHGGSTTRCNPRTRYVSADTSFVSVFNKYRMHQDLPVHFQRSINPPIVETLKRAQFLYMQCCQKIFIACIDAGWLIKRQEGAQSSGYCSPISVWVDQNDSSDMWISMEDVGPVLGIPRRFFRKSKWLACGGIL